MVESLPEMCGEHFGDQTIQRSVTGSNDTGENGRYNEILRFADDKVHAGRAQTRRHRTKDEEELTAQPIHTDDSYQVGR